MRQEHKFCAEVYHRLYDRIDHTKRVLFCLDGWAAQEAARRQEVRGATIPDLCFTLIGGRRELRIEAKIIENRRIKIGAAQRGAWCRNGTRSLQPHLWIAANEQLTQFYHWEHNGFCRTIAAHVNSKQAIRVFDVGQGGDGVTLPELVVRVLTYATRKGFCPEGE
jgi:hypothetical protein